MSHDLQHAYLEIVEFDWRKLLANVSILNLLSFVFPLKTIIASLILPLCQLSSWSKLFKFPLNTGGFHLFSLIADSGWRHIGLCQGQWSAIFDQQTVYTAGRINARFGPRVDDIQLYIYFHLMGNSVIII